MKLRVSVLSHLNTTKSSTSRRDEQRQVRGWLNSSEFWEDKRELKLPSGSKGEDKGYRDSIKKTKQVLLDK